MRKDALFFVLFLELEARMRAGAVVARRLGLERVRFV